MKDNKKRIRVYMSGVWDLFHVGHLNAIKKAREIGDELIVGVNSDELVMKYKKRLPVIPYEQRAEVISSLKYVDKVIKQNEIFELSLVKELNPDILIIEDTWIDKYVEGLEWAKHQGRKIVYLPRTPGISTYEIKERIKKLH